MYTARGYLKIESDGLSYFFYAIVVHNQNCVGACARCNYYYYYYYYYYSVCWIIMH